MRAVAYPLRSPPHQPSPTQSTPPHPHTNTLTNTHTGMIHAIYISLADTKVNTKGLPVTQP